MAKMMRENRILGRADDRHDLAGYQGRAREARQWRAEADTEMRSAESDPRRRDRLLQSSTTQQRHLADHRQLSG